MVENKRLECPLCHGTQFKKEEGKIDSKWGFSAHKVDLVIFELTFIRGTRERNPIAYYLIQNYV